MDVLDFQKSLESLIDWVLETDPDEVSDYVDELYLKDPQLDRRKIAEKIIDEQSFNNGLLGAVTGLGGLITLPATVPIDIVKAWSIQSFTIQCIAYLYGYTPQKTDLKTDIFLVLSSGSLEDIKKIVIQEFLSSAPKQASKSIDFVKGTAIKKTGEVVPKYAAKAITKYGGKKVANYTMKGISKHLTKALWKVGGKKVAQKALQKSIGKAVPVVGAVVGGGIDWFATQAIGKLAVEYYENATPEWIDETFEMYEKSMKKPYLIPIEPSLGKEEALIFIDGYLSQVATQPEDNGHWWWAIRQAGWKGSIYHLWWDASEFNTLLTSISFSGVGAISHWQKHKARAKKVGIEYVPQLFKSLPEKKVSLVGFSLGSRVAYYIMRDWSEPSVELHDVVLLAGAVRRGNSKDWGGAVSHITGQLLNIYNSDDLVLNTLCKSLELNRSSCGIKPIKEGHARILNIDATKAMNTSEHSGGSYRRIFDKAVGRKLWS